MSYKKQLTEVFKLNEDTIDSYTFGKQTSANNQVALKAFKIDPGAISSAQELQEALRKIQDVTQTAIRELGRRISGIDGVNPEIKQVMSKALIALGNLRTVRAVGKGEREPQPKTDAEKDPRRPGGPGDTYGT